MEQVERKCPKPHVTLQSARVAGEFKDSPRSRHGDRWEWTHSSLGLFGALRRREDKLGQRALG